MSTIAVHSTAIRPGYAPNGTSRPVRHLYAVPTPGHHTGLRLTTRGRVVLFIAAIAAILLMGVTLGGSTAATNRAGAPSATQTITVLAGQTLWQIAVAANPNGDIRQTVDDIMKLNSLPNAAGLQMGRDLAVPVYSE